jgi:hypothetical protein
MPVAVSSHCCPVKSPTPVGAFAATMVAELAASFVPVTAPALSFSVVTPLFAILPVVTLRSAIEAVSTAPVASLPAVIVELAILAPVTARSAKAPVARPAASIFDVLTAFSAILSVVTAPSAIPAVGATTCA